MFSQYPQICLPVTIGGIMPHTKQLLGLEVQTIGTLSVSLELAWSWYIILDGIVWRWRIFFFSFYMKLFAFGTYKIIWTAHRLTDSFICVLIKKAAAFQELILHGWYLHLQIALPHHGNLQPTPGIHHRTTSPASVLYGLCLQIQVSVFTYK